MTETIGFIGLGAMGKPMASNLAKKGFALVVYDTDAAPVKAISALGARAVGSVAEVARAADIVFTMLPNSPDVEAVVLGAGGIAAAARKDTLVVDMSTIDPIVTDKLAARLREAGLGFVDAPVGRTVTQAITGESLFMVGASDNDFGRVKPALGGMGTTIIHCGPAGAGIRMKLVNNFLAVASCQLTAEALALAQKFGLDIKTTLEVCTGTTATNGHLTRMWPIKVLSGDTAPGFRIELAHKDMSLVVDAAGKFGVPVPMGAAAREALSVAKGTDDYAMRDFSALLDLVCQQSRVNPPRMK
ncbi:MAG: NAD(P)-dependent oxidoreductase [Alphaproteobacteria bacterium]